MVFTYGQRLKSLLSEIVNVKTTNYNSREYHLLYNLTYSVLYDILFQNLLKRIKELNLDSERWMKNDTVLTNKVFQLKISF